MGRNDAVSFRLDEEADRRKKRERKRERERKEAPFHLEMATKNIEPFRSLPLLFRHPRAAPTHRKSTLTLFVDYRLHSQKVAAFTGKQSPIFFQKDSLVHASQPSHK